MEEQVELSSQTRRNDIFQSQRGEKSVAKTQYDKGTRSTTNQRNRYIKCFKCLDSRHIVAQCPNKRTMILLDSWEIASENKGDSDFMPPLEDASGTEHGVVGQTLVVLWAPHVKTLDDKGEQKHENISCLWSYHGWRNLCQCCLYADNWQVWLGEKKTGLALRLRWLNECGEMQVTK